MVAEPRMRLEKSENCLRFPWLCLNSIIDSINLEGPEKTDKTTIALNCDNGNFKHYDTDDFVFVTR